MSGIVAALTHLFFFTRETASSGPDTGSIGHATVHRGVKRSIADTDNDDDEIQAQSCKRFKADPCTPLDDIPAVRKPITLGRTTSPLSPHPVLFVRKSLPRSRSCRKPLPLHRQALLRWHDIGLKKRHPNPARPPLLLPRKSTPLPPIQTNDFRHNLGARSTKPHSYSHSHRSSHSFPSHHSSRSLPPPPRSSRSGPWQVSSERQSSYTPSSRDLDMFEEGDDFDEDDEFDDDESDEEISDEEDERPVKDYGQQIVLDSTLAKVTPSPVSMDIVNLPIPPVPALTRVDADGPEEMDEDDSSSDSDEDESDWDVVLTSETRVPPTPTPAIKLPLPITTDASSQTTLVPASLYDDVRVGGTFDGYA
jgi:hypothetical protein